jgi:hypothetical protein
MCRRGRLGDVDALGLRRALKLSYSLVANRNLTLDDSPRSSSRGRPGRRGAAKNTRWRAVRSTPEQHTIIANRWRERELWNCGDGSSPTGIDTGGIVDLLRRIRAA